MYEKELKAATSIFPQTGIPFFGIFVRNDPSEFSSLGSAVVVPAWQSRLPQFPLPSSTPRFSFLAVTSRFFLLPLTDFLPLQFFFSILWPWRFTHSRTEKVTHSLSIFGDISLISTLFLLRADGHQGFLSSWKPPPSRPTAAQCCVHFFFLATKGGENRVSLGASRDGSSRQDKAEPRSSGA